MDDKNPQASKHAICIDSSSTYTAEEGSSLEIISSKEIASSDTYHPSTVTIDSTDETSDGSKISWQDLNKTLQNISPIHSEHVAEEPQAELEGEAEMSPQPSTSTPIHSPQPSSHEVGESDSEVTSVQASASSSTTPPTSMQSSPGRFIHQ